MNLGEVRAAVRTKIDDNVLPYLWSDDQLNVWINEAVMEVCLRARSLQDSTSGFCNLGIVAGQNRYELDPSIILVRRAKLASLPSAQPLVATTMGVLDMKFPGWDDPAEAGVPQYMFTNKDNTNHLSLFIAPYPYQNDTLNLTVWRMPVDAEHLDSDSDEIPLPLHFHKDLEYWPEYKAYEIKDVETYDPNRSLAALAVFTDRYGERPTAHDIKLMGQNRLRGTRPSYF